MPHRDDPPPTVQTIRGITNTPNANNIQYALLMVGNLDGGQTRELTKCTMADPRALYGASSMAGGPAS